MIGLRRHRRAPLECLVTARGAEYRGRRAHTRHGRPCQRWDVRGLPSTDNFRQPLMFADGSVHAARHFCRNPGGTRQHPWCYVTSDGAFWEYCDIPKCGCRHTKIGAGYNGSVSITTSGRRCRRWAALTSHRYGIYGNDDFPDSSVEAAGNYCRNPGKGKRQGPWCHVAGSKTITEYCKVPYCECRTTPQGLEYRGRISRTWTGKTCQRWDSQVPHRHAYEEGDHFLDDVGESANYCRNPGPGHQAAPWCFTLDPRTRWQYCDVPLCEGSFLEKSDFRVTPSMASKTTEDNATFSPTALPLQTGVLSSVSLFLPLLLLLLVAMVIVVAWKGRTWLRHNETSTAHNPTVGFVNPLYTGSGTGKSQHCLCGKPTIIRSLGYDDTQCIAKASFVELWPRRHQH